MVRTRRLALFLLCTAIAATTAFLRPFPAQAAHAASIGIGTCEGNPEISLDPGEVVTIEACFSRNGSPLSDHPFLFVEDGPSPTDLTEAVTDQEGRARLSLSSPKPGVSRVTACDLEGCFNPVKISWLLAGVEPPDDPPSPPPLIDTAAAPVVPPLVADIGRPVTGTGFSCRRGPGAPTIQAPGHVEIVSVSEISRPHPSSGSERPAVRVTAKANLMAGAVLYSEPSVVFVSTVLPGQAVAERGEFPFRGFNRILAVFATPTGRFGKQELRYLDRRWASVPPEFSVAMAHDRIDVVSDGAPVEHPAVGARAGGLCSASGYDHMSGVEEAPPTTPVGRKSPMFITLGVLMLLLVGGLAMGVMRATEPPRGILVENPTTIAVRSERGQITYDQFARPTGYVDIIALPDGTTSTVRTRIHQEGLVLDAVDFLDTTDWDVPTFEITRYDFENDEAGRPVAFIEDTLLSDGTRYRARISDIRYAAGGGVSRYARSVTVVMSETRESRARLETVELTHEGDPVDPGPIRMAARERVERSEIRHDVEGHVAGYVSLTLAKYGGPDEEDRPELPRLLYESGRGIPHVPSVQSQPNTGLTRLRHVLLRWFRQHACRVEVRLMTADGTGFANAMVRFGDAMVRLDHRGRQTLWVLRPGDYAVVLDDDAELEELDLRTPRPHPRPKSGLVGWVSIVHVPGYAEATFEASAVTQSIGSA